MANLPPGFILDAPKGGLPEGFSLDSDLKDGPNSPSPEAQDSPDDTMKYLAKMAKAIYGGPFGAATDLAYNVGTNPGAVYRGVKRQPEAPDASSAANSANFVGRAAVPMAAGTAMGMAFGPVGAGTGALRGLATTAAAEGAAGLMGEGAGQLAAHALGNNEAFSGKEMLAQGALSAGLGGAARGLGEVAIKGIPHAKGAAKTVTALAGKYGINLTPAEITASRALSGLEVFLEKTMLGSGGIAARREANNEALRVAKDKLLAKAGTDKERQAIGLAFFDQVKSRAEGFNNAVREMYRRVAATVPAGEAIQADNFIQTAERLAAMQKRSPFGGSGTSGQKVVDFFDGNMTYHVPGEGAAAEAAAGSVRVKGSPAVPAKKPRYTPSLKGTPDIQDPSTGAVTKGQPEVPGYQIPESDDVYGIGGPRAGTPSRTVNQGFMDLTGAPESAAVDPSGIPVPGNGFKSRTVTLGNRVDPTTGVKMPVKISPEDLIEIRTDLTQAIADNDAGLKIGLRTMSSRQAGAYKMLLASVEKDLDAYAASSVAGKEFVTKYRAAKGLAKLNYDIFNNPNVVNVLKRNPEAVTAIIGRDSVSEIQRLKRASGDKGFDEIRKVWLTGLLNEEKNATGKSLVNALAKHSDDTLREVFKSDQKALAELMEIAKLQSLVGSAERMTPLTGSARGVVSTGLTTVGAVLGATGGPIGAGVGVVAANLAPYQIAKIYLSKEARKLVLNGLKAAPGSRAKAIAAARLAAFASKAAVTK